ncbi:MAG: UDP-3-O-(3-hydroxymyristoyl)glucosamine N-acyltransferase [Halothiobacillus sp.]
MQINPSNGLSAAEIADHVSASLLGSAERRVLSVASLSSATSRDLAYFSGPRRGVNPQQSQAGTILCRTADIRLMPEQATLICVPSPQLAFIDIVEWMYPRQNAYSGVAASAVIHPTVKLAPNVVIGPLVVIGANCLISAGAVVGTGTILGQNVRIGEDTELVARVTVLDDCEIGARCLIQPGVVIGSDGFGLANDQGRWRRVPQLGRVIIGDDVDIGANTTIDRGALDDTRIANGVKLDNLIQIAHNVEIGEHSAVAGCAGLAGSSVVGKHCTLGGGVGLAGHLTLADGVHVTGMSMVTRSIHQAGVYSAGTPLDTNERWHKNAARFKQLDRIAHRVQALELRLNAFQNPNEEVL